MWSERAHTTATLLLTLQTFILSLSLKQTHIFTRPGRVGALNPADVLSQPSGAEAFGCLEELEEVLK